MLETPANPTNGLVDLAGRRRHRRRASASARATARRSPSTTRCSARCTRSRCGTAPTSPLYSLTKYAGGHSDLVAGGVSGGAELVRRIMLLRGALGTQLDPHSCWMLLRSLETLGIRAEPRQRQRPPGRRVSAQPPQASRAVHYLGASWPRATRARPVFDRQCTAPGSTFSFDVDGGEAEAFAFLDRLQVMKLAVSLGGTETLISHPASTTHSGVPRDLREEIGLTDALIRISVGIEHPDDLIADLEQALGSGDRWHSSVATWLHGVAA